MAADDRWRSVLLDRFTFVLGAVVLTVFVLLMFDLPTRGEETAGGEVAVTFLTGVTLVFALLASGVSRPLLGLAVVAAVSTALWAMVSLTAGLHSVAYLRWFWFVLVLGTPFVVLRRLVSHQKVTSQTLFGAASVYLLIAVAFMFLFIAIDASDAGQFFGEAEPTTSFMYFSLVTITTLGYGDLTPVTEPARALAVAAAIVGQIYLVFIVARMVGLYTRDGGTGESDRSS
jgi:hypothetical protein